MVIPLAVIWCHVSRLKLNRKGFSQTSGNLAIGYIAQYREIPIKQFHGGQWVWTLDTLDFSFVTSK